MAQTYGGRIFIGIGFTNVNGPANIESAIISKLQTAAINGLFDAKGNFNPEMGTNIKAGNFQIQITTDPATGGLTLVTTDVTSGQSTSININALGGLQ